MGQAAGFSSAGYLAVSRLLPVRPREDQDLDETNGAEEERSVRRRVEGPEAEQQSVREEGGTEYEQPERGDVEEDQPERGHDEARALKILHDPERPTLARNEKNTQYSTIRSDPGVDIVYGGKVYPDPIVK